MYKTIKKFLAEGGKCLLIENGEPVGVVLTIEEYNKFHQRPEAQNPRLNDAVGQANSEIKEEVSAVKPVETVASAEIADIEAVDDVTLEDLGIDELPY